MQDPAAAPQMLVEFTNPDYVNTYMEKLTVVGDTLFFSADADTGTYDLWKSDGTTAGTQMVKDLPPEVDTLYSWTVSSGELLFFVGRSGAYDKYELWRSDGTAAGTGRAGIAAAGQADDGCRRGVFRSGPPRDIDRSDDGAPKRVKQEGAYENHTLQRRTIGA